VIEYIVVVEPMPRPSATAARMETPGELRRIRVASRMVLIGRRETGDGRRKGLGLPPYR
jgi:hypothetical protein